VAHVPGWEIFSKTCEPCLQDRGDGGPATSATLDYPAEVTLDSAGDLFIGDKDANVVREVAPNGIITTVAGAGIDGYSGDGGPATMARLSAPSGLAIDDAGDLFISDQGNQRIRKVSNGIITTVAGSGIAGYSGDGGPPTSY
jgi:hypothetical protein